MQQVAVREAEGARSLPGTTRLADASRVARAAAETQRERARTALRAPVHSIDVLLDELERVNLRGGATTDTPQVADWLVRLEGDVALTAPPWVREVPDTVRLHAAILRWQGQLLDQYRPDRRGIGDMHDDPLDFILLPPAVLGTLLTRRRVA